MGHIERRYSYTPRPLVGHGAKPFAKVSEIEEIIKQLAPETEISSRVYPPIFVNKVRTDPFDGVKESPIHKAYHFDGMSVLLQVELGYKFAEGLYRTKLHLVTKKEHMEYKSEMERLEKERARLRTYLQS